MIAYVVCYDNHWNIVEAFMRMIIIIKADTALQTLLARSLAFT